ncbi:MAG TPA: methyl-accepting chemotaxis protein [Clostridia bacterium]|nr:methyl-accepting chemotaxis protein [Clostridia bacterium]
MKKISTRIVVLSLANTALITVLNSLSMTFMQSFSGAAPADAAGTVTGTAAGSAAGAVPGGQGGAFVPTNVLITTAVCLIIGAVVSYFLGRYISNPIVKLTEIANNASDLNLVLDGSYEKALKYKDETGNMARALSKTINTLRGVVTKLQGMSGKLEEHSEKLTSAADDNVRSITQVVTAINEIAEGNSNQAERINEINVTMADAAALIDDVAQKALAGAVLADKSLVSIEEGRQAVDTQNRKMQESISASDVTCKYIAELRQLIEQVSGIAGVITSISDQTNMLALNAAIEAARAGEAGNGFAVVAAEIRNLAEGSRKEAEHISEIIIKTTEKAERAVNSINSTNSLINEEKSSLAVTQNAFRKIKDAFDLNVESFRQTAEAMKTVSEKSEKILDQTREMAAIAEESAASAEQASAAGQEQLASFELISQSAKELQALVEDLDKETGRFKLN